MSGSTPRSAPIISAPLSLKVAKDATHGEGIWHEDYRAPIGGGPHKNSGPVSSTVLIFDASFVEIRNLDIANSRLPDTSDSDSKCVPFNALSALDRTGVALIAQDEGTMDHIVLERLHIHDVDGNVYNKHMANGGIYAIVHFPADSSRIEDTIARFNDITIRNNTVQRTRRWGISVGYTAYLNYIDHGERDAATGQWLNRFDYGDGTVYRHNFSSHNSGGTVMFCNEKAVNSQFYCNTAYHDHMGAVDIPRNPDAYVHHNVFIMADDCEPLRTARADGTAIIESNVFINETRDPYDYTWHPPHSHVTWKNNRFIGFTNRPEED